MCIHMLDTENTWCFFTLIGNTLMVHSSKQYIDGDFTLSYQLLILSLTLSRVVEMIYIRMLETENTWCYFTLISNTLMGRSRK